MTRYCTLLVLITVARLFFAARSSAWRWSALLRLCRRALLFVVKDMQTLFPVVLGVSSGEIGCSTYITRCSDGTLMTGMRWTFVDADQCNEKVSVAAY
jgi:hypothetical protein